MIDFLSHKWVAAIIAAQEAVIAEQRELIVLLEFLRGSTARAPASKRQRLTADATATGSGAPTGDASDATEDAA